MEESPGALVSPCGVSTLMPEQQPQVQSGVPPQLIGSSLPPHQVQGQLAVVRKTGIVFHSRDLKSAQRQFSGGEIRGCVHSLRLELGGLYRRDACYRSNRRVNG